MPAPRRCSPPSTCSYTPDKNRCCLFRSAWSLPGLTRQSITFAKSFTKEMDPRVKLAGHKGVAAVTRSAQRIGDDLAEIFVPFRAVIERFGGIKKVQVDTLRQRFCIRPRREEVAIAQDVLRVREHEFEEEDRGVRMRGAARNRDPLETPHAGRDDEPVDRRTAFAQLLGLVGVGRERERNFSADYEVDQQGVALAHG